MGTHNLMGHLPLPPAGQITGALPEMGWLEMGHFEPPVCEDALGAELGLSLLGRKKDG